MPWTPEDELAILDTIEKWVEKDVRPIADEYDQEDKYPAVLVEQMKELGLFGSTISEEYGGLGLSASTYAQIVIAVASKWMAPSGIFNSHLIMASASERAGSEEMKQLFLPKMATGEWRGGIALTEPNAGTDLQAIRTRAVKQGDEYLITGAKTWITNSLNGNCLLVLAKTDPDAQPRYKGMTMFAVRTKADEGNFLPGITVTKMKKLGYKAIDTCEITFEDFRVPASSVVNEEGQGFFITVGGLELGRINVAARGAGIAKGALDLSVRYAQERESMGKPICQHQAI